MLFGFASSRLMAETRASSFVAKALQSYTIPAAFVASDLHKAKLMNNSGYLKGCGLNLVSTKG